MDAPMSFSLYPPDALIGHEIAGYELTDFIDSGAASLVFRGKRVAEAPAVPVAAGAPPAPAPDVAAIKLLAPSSVTPTKNLTDFQRRFQREADVLKRLTHPHILPVIASGKDADAGYFYMALPYMEHGSLASGLSAHAPQSLAAAEALLAQLAEALDYAHAQGVVHRDVKPANILLDAQGAPCLSDFGIMRLLSDTTTQQTTMGRVMGSPAYMSPEQFADPSRVGPLSDIYSLGMVIYQMVTGHVAFEATTWSALIHQQLYEAPPTPRRVRLDLPEPAAVAILKALEKDHALRFPTAAAFAQAFALGLQGEWADGLTEYMAGSTITAATIMAPIAPAATPVASGLTDPSADLTWANDVTVGGQPVGRLSGAWRGNHTMAVAAVLLLISCLAGFLYLDAASSAVQSQKAQITSRAVASAKATRTPTPIAPTPTRTPPPRPTATQAPSGDGGGEDTSGNGQQSSLGSSHGKPQHKHHD